MLRKGVDDDYTIIRGGSIFRLCDNDVAKQNFVYQAIDDSLNVDAIKLSIM